MAYLQDLYTPSLALFTDLSDLVAAAALWRSGVGEREAVFHATLRANGGYLVACGVEPALELLASLRFSLLDLDWLGRVEGADNKALFDPGFLEYIEAMRFRCDVDAVREGTVVFDEPIVRVRGPIAQAQLVRTALLGLVAFQTQVATTAARLCLAAKGDPVIAEGGAFDNALSAARAAYVGGVAATGHVAAARLLGLPLRPRSGDAVDERTIETLKAEGAVRTWSARCDHGEPSDGVYELSAQQDERGAWQDRLPTDGLPGCLQVRRFSLDGALVGDLVYDVERPIEDPRLLVDPLDPTRRKLVPDGAVSVDLLEPALRRGDLVGPRPTLADARLRAREQLASLHSSHKRLFRPRPYPVGVERGLQRRREFLLAVMRGVEPGR